MRHIACFATLCTLLSGCAEYATFRSSPPNATVYLNDQVIGLTPMEYPIPKNQVQETWNYRVEMEGYEPDTGILHRRVAPGRIDQYGGRQGLSGGAVAAA